MNKKTKTIENERPLTRVDVTEIVTEIVTRIVNSAIAASEERMISRMDEKFEHADQAMKSGLNLVYQKIEEGNEYMDRHVSVVAKVLSKMDHRVDKLERFMEKLRARPA